MAKRKRKMTLFDVINTGQPIGLQVRQRVPTYQPTPELPVTKKIAKLFGRKPAEDPDRPLTAAEQLAQLRSELSTSEEPPAPKPAAKPKRVAKVVEPEPEPEPTYTRSYRDSYHDEEPAPEPIITRSRVAELAARAEAAERPEPPPRKPRKPISQSIRERWDVVAPKLATAAESLAGHTKWLSSKLALGSKFVGGHAREAGGRYGAGALAAIGVIVVMGGAFYAGRLLLSRPAVNLPGGDLADGTVRPEVMNLDPSTAARANEAIANVSERNTETKLERKPETAAPTAQRQLDLNYVVVQSYYSRSEADIAVEVLARNDIKATVEENLPRWSNPSSGKTIYSVVTVDGFAKMAGNQVYQRFIESIRTISQREANKSLPKQGFDPIPYRFQAK